MQFEANIHYPIHFKGGFTVEAYYAGLPVFGDPPRTTKLYGQFSGVDVLLETIIRDKGVGHQLTVYGPTNKVVDLEDWHVFSSEKNKWSANEQ